MVDGILWFYENYCAKIHIPIEIVLIFLAAVFIHFAMSYVRDTASHRAHDQTQTTSTASASGVGSIALSGNGNNIKVVKPNPDKTRKEEVGPK